MNGGGEWKRESIRQLSLPRLPHWERLEDPQAEMVLAHPEVPYGVFRPNLVVRVEPALGATMPRIATAALASTLKVWDDVHIVSNDVAVTNGLQGRKQKFVYQVRDQTVCVDRWLWLAGDDAVEISGSYTVDQLLGMEPLFEDMVGLVDFHGYPAEGA